MEPQFLLNTDTVIPDFLWIVSAIIAGGFLITMLCAISVWISLLIQTKDHSMFGSHGCV